MADLDDFFAKKDRKKKPTKKYVTPEDLSKKLEITTPKVADTKSKKEQPQKPSNPSDNDAEIDPNAVAEVIQDEWKDFQEEEKKDYSGLKLGHLQLNDDDYAETDGDADDGEGEDGEKRAGPWSKKDEAAATGAANEATTASRKPEPVEKKEPGTSKYISPALRNQQQQQLLKPINLRKGLLPDIHNQEYFPTLGAAKAEELKRKKNEPAFEEVRHGGRLQRPNESGLNAPVAVENRYNSLADS